MKNYFYTTVLALALLTAYAVSQTSSPQSNPAQSGTDKSVPQSVQAAARVDDQTLQSKIHDQLATNPSLVGITVAVRNGVATLAGKVASKQDRKDAINIAAAVPGVKSVKDKLSVETSSNTVSGAGSSTTTSPDNTPHSPDDKSNPKQSPSNQTPPDQSTPK
jgi:hyperosmotically inducible protein